MSDIHLFIDALILALKLSEIGGKISGIGYYPSFNELIVYLVDRRAVVKVGEDLSGIELTQIVLEVIRIETGGSENG